MIDLGLPLGAVRSYALALNDVGEVVGTVEYPPGSESFSGVSFRYAGGVMQPLRASNALGINNSGQIIADNLSPASFGVSNIGFRLDPVVTLPTKADADGDGRSDVFWRNATTGDVNVWLLDSNNALRSDSDNIGTVADPNWTILGTGDFDGDGKADLLWRNTATGDVNIWFMDGTAIKGTSGSITSINPTVWQYAGTGDFDHDGVSDIVWRNSATGDVYVWLMNGLTLKPGSGFVGNAPTGSWEIIGVGDFDGDLKSDLLWHNKVTGDINVWFLDGAAIRPQSANISNLDPTLWQIGGTADLDGDYKDDIIWRNATSGDVYIWYMDGTAWKNNSGYAEAAPPGVWSIVGVASYGVLWRSVSHDIGWDRPYPLSTFSVSPIGNVGTAQWQSVRP